jgi:hypothetical protein
MTLEEIATELDTIANEMLVACAPGRLDDVVSAARRRYCLAVAMRAVTQQAAQLRHIAGVTP